MAPARSTQRAEPAERPATLADTDADPEISYAGLTRLIERLHRRHLDVIRRAMEESNAEDLTPVQALLLTKVEERTVSVRDLIAHGYHLGPNAAYNLRQLVSNGYLEQERYAQDRRVHRVRQTAKGRAICARIAIGEAHHAETLAGDDAARVDIAGALRLLRRLEHIWGDHLSLMDSKPASIRAHVTERD